jgi:hypothetical protein
MCVSLLCLILGATASWIPFRAFMTVCISEMSTYVQLASQFVVPISDTPVTA